MIEAIWPRVILHSVPGPLGLIEKPVGKLEIIKVSQPEGVSSIYTG